MKTISKSFIACLCMISMVMSSVITAQAAGTTLTVGKTTLTQASGEEIVQIPINLSGNTGIAGMTLKISYTEGLTLTDITKGSALASLTMTKPGILSANPFNIVWDGQDADTSNGTVATLSFKVPKNTVKDYEITVLTDGVFDNAPDEIAINITNGKISVQEAAGTGDGDIVLGDVNSDGEVDFIDAILLLKYDAGLITFSDTQKKNGDVNSDGEADFVDAILVLKYDAGLISSFGK